MGVEAFEAECLAKAEAREKANAQVQCKRVIIKRRKRRGDYVGDSSKTWWVCLKYAKLQLNICLSKASTMPSRKNQKNREFWQRRKAEKKAAKAGGGKTSIYNAGRTEHWTKRRIVLAGKEKGAKDGCSCRTRTLQNM